MTFRVLIPITSPSCKMKWKQSAESMKACQKTRTESKRIICVKEVFELLSGVGELEGGGSQDRHGEASLGQPEPCLARGAGTHSRLGPQGPPCRRNSLKQGASRCFFAPFPGDSLGAL